MNIEHALAQAAHALEQAGVENARTDARLLMRHVLGISLEMLVMEGGRELLPEQWEQFESRVALRASRRPMAQILGRREFWGLEFAVTPDTLDPRPDSESIIEALLAHQPIRGKQLKILDLGTGTGCLLLAALSEYPQAIGLGVDISERALAVAQGNARALGLENRADFKKSDWNSEINGVWDVVLSNPPYIPTEEIPRLAPEVARYEPKTALDGGEDGLGCYRTITRFLPQILVEGGIALLEVGAGQAADVSRLATDQGLESVGTARDLSGVDRCVILRK